MIEVSWNFQFVLMCAGALVIGWNSPDALSAGIVALLWWCVVFFLFRTE